MEKPIRHLHVRSFASPLAQVVAIVDALWGQGALDAVPPALHGWRRTKGGAPGFVEGTRFGHGLFSFFVEKWDGRTLRARIETAGFRGYHGFELECEGERVVVTHDLNAQLTLSRWVVWQLLFARSHDWAVEAVFDRMHILLRDGQPALVSREPPLAMRAFSALRRRLKRATRETPAPEGGALDTGYLDKRMATLRLAKVRR